MKHDGVFLRRLAMGGAARGPVALLRVAPPFFGALFWALRPEQRSELEKMALASAGVGRALGDRSVVTVIVRAPRIVNIVTK